MPSSITAGDGDLMPPRYNGDRRVDADDWLKIFLTVWRCAGYRWPTRLLCMRLTGTARTWLEGMPADIPIEDVVARFQQRC